MSILPTFDPATGSVLLPVWLAGAAAALVVVLCALALRASRSGALGATLRVALVLIALVTLYAFVDRSALRDHSAERHALDTRAAELNARALMPGSALACLDAGTGEAVENACEKTVFARPEAAAAAVAYIGARLDLLAAGLRFATHAEPDYAATLTALRRSLELDRYGVVAQVLATRDGCTTESCAAFALFSDASAVKANLKEHAYEKYVARYAPGWTAPPAPPVAEAAPEAPPNETAAGAGAPNEAKPHSTVKFEYPSSASIPPVSIMNPEPPTGDGKNATAAKRTQGQAASAPPAPAPAPAPAARQ